jgi:hypothetical protein
MTTTDIAAQPEPQHRRPRGGRLVSTLLCLFIAGMTLVAGPNPASASVDFPSGAWVVTVATSDCTDHTIDIHPNPSAGSEWTTYSMAQVWDYTQSKWLTSGWQVDEIQNVHRFVNMSSFYGWAYVTYARYEYGRWVYRYEYVPITSDVSSIWCANINFG